MDTEKSNKNSPSQFLQTGGGKTKSNAIEAPSINLPKGGGAIRGIGEKFAANPVTGTGSMSVPIAMSPGRSGFGPQLSLSYDSGAGNGPFGLGWSLSIPSITRKTDKGLPQYLDAQDSDEFILSGAEDLVPVYRQDSDGSWVRDKENRFIIHEDEIEGYLVRRYRPRIEGLFARIERWTKIDDRSDVHWRSISKDNILTIYGSDNNSRIVDPEDDKRIFSWLIIETRDDKGNAVIYRYKAEDGLGVDLGKANERNRGARDDPSRTANRYLKSIHYGNRTPLLEEITGNRPRFLDKAKIDKQIADTDWMFEVVFDYGEHDAEAPKPNDQGKWAYRPDPFSRYRSGFEVRTTRLCQHVLMFHHFKEQLEPQDCLVQSTDFTYSYEEDSENASNPVYTFLKAVANSGYRFKNGGYEKRCLPPVEFEYTKPVVEETVHEVDDKSLENLPVGVDGADYQWIDLHGEGIPGILTEQGGAWFYKRNLSPICNHDVEFAAMECVATKPNLPLGRGVSQFMDLDGDGQPDLVTLEGPMSGLYEHDDAEGWQPFCPFTSNLIRDLHDPNLKFIDLDGDGLADVLITEEDAFAWHTSLGEGGFGPEHRVTQMLDEEKGPRVVFADGTQSIYLADLSGDGLTDLVRIRNGEICYWPNLGYGRFGAKITMDMPKVTVDTENVSVFDNPDQFDQKRIRLADIDGSGTTDILYLHRDGVRLYFNQSGNSWSKPQQLNVFPHVDDIVSIVPTDLLGNGTACLIWSSPLPGNSGRQMRYVSLMGEEKPHLLVKTVNNLGEETRVKYASSTKFYLQDKRDGKAWITRLPFPVHVVETVETVDYISRNHFVSRYKYHHGYFDGEEREFRGFGMVEEWDCESFEDYFVGVQRDDGSQELAPELNQPPVTTRTWYHTGAFLGQDCIMHQYNHEYYQQKQYIPESILPSGLSAVELRECSRALKGLPLRQEIYSFDGSDDAQHPYSVVENNYEIRFLQPKEKQLHCVLFPIGRESVSFNFERNPADPRISHSLGLEVDEYGNFRKSCSVVYGRQGADPSLPAEVTRDQKNSYITYTEMDFLPDIEQNILTEVYRLRSPFESRNYEITGIASTANLFQFEEIKAEIASAAPIEYEIIANGVMPQRRLLSHSRILFLDNHLNTLPLGQWDSLGLGYQSYHLVFTPGIIDTYYADKVSDAEFITAGYVHFDGDMNWWIPSNTAVYFSNPREHFYIPKASVDPLGVKTIATLDQYDLLLEKVEIEQADWNVITATNDYRVLSPIMMTDHNKNRSAIEYDELGMVIKTAIMGKEGSTDGDTLADPTTWMEYELFNWTNNRQPNFVHTFAREQHGDLNPRWQESYTYSNGGGNVAMVKIQAHPGKAFQVNPDNTKVEVEANPRWVGNGRTILNNKGNPVKQYEPYFSVTYEYENEKSLQEIGITPILYYDPIGRNIRTLFPNGTFTQVEFNPWIKKVFDTNDTVKESQWYIDRGSPDPTMQSEPLNNPECRAAWLAAKHADTPGVIHFDSLGRFVYAVSDYGGGKTAAVRSESDLTGRFSKMFDQKQREVASGFVSMSGTPIVGVSAEKGRRWTFQNALGALVKTWDENGRQIRVNYDILNRPVSTFVQEAGQDEILFNYIVYGDRLANAEKLNLLGTPHQIFDQAGMIRVPELDFKGNPKFVERILAQDYKNDLDWSVLAKQPDYTAIQTAANPALEIGEVFTASSIYDALNRPTRVTLPDGTVIEPTYNEANFLTSLRARIRGQGNFIEFLRDQDYDAKGQRQFAHYGNGVFTRYFYDPNTFRLTNLLTYRSDNVPQTQGLQNLCYIYDPVGNITQICDDAQQTHYFNNAVVNPENLYEYDAVYQLVRATGREHAGMGNNSIRTHIDLDFVPQLPHANNTDAVRTYTEEYEYDLLGNIKTLKHRFRLQPGIGSGWTRHYRYTFEDDPANCTNQLTSSSMPGDLDSGPYSATYEYDVYGNMTHMPHLAAMDWNFMDQLRRVDLGGGGTAHYVYGLGGQRMRKVIERDSNLKIEWIFLGAVTIFRRHRRDTNELRLERWTVDISDNTGHIAQVDTKTRDDDNNDPANPLNVVLIRYQYSNHLGSAVLETDENGNPISYEEYHPYGTTAYRFAKSGFDLSLKRYRFSGKERDEETGLYYFGARYFASWLGRWTSSDLFGVSDGLNLFKYCQNNPINLSDKYGFESEKLKELGRVESTLSKEEATRQFNLEHALERGLWVTGMKRYGKNNWRITSERPLSENDMDVLGVIAMEDEVVTAGPPSSTTTSLGEGGENTKAYSNQSPDSPTTGNYRDAASGGSALSLSSAGAERFIWDYNFKNQGVPGAQRGRILEWMYGNSWRSNTKNYDIETATEVQQIKTTKSYDKIGNITRSATRDADAAIQSTPGMKGKSPQAVMITPTDAPTKSGNDIKSALDPGSRRKIPKNAAPPIHVRGLPGAIGMLSKGLTGGGTALSTFAFVYDFASGDYSMASADTLSTVGGGLELYAIGVPGASIAGFSAMSVGLGLGGAGIAIASGIGSYRSFKSGDTVGGIVGVLGSIAGIAITMGIIFSSPALLVGGIIGATVVGLIHFGRWLW